MVTCLLTWGLTTGRDPDLRGGPHVAHRAPPASSLHHMPRSDGRPASPFLTLIRSALLESPHPLGSGDYSSVGLFIWDTALGVLASVTESARVASSSQIPKHQDIPE